MRSLSGWTAASGPNVSLADPQGLAGRTTPPRPFAELLIDCEEDRVLRAMLVGMLREMEP
jgi:hypothetical protein